MKSHEKGSKPAKSAEPQSSASKAQPEKTVSLVLSYCPLSYFLALLFMVCKFLSLCLSHKLR